MGKIFRQSNRILMMAFLCQFFLLIVGCDLLFPPKKEDLKTEPISEPNLDPVIVGEWRVGSSDNLTPLVEISLIKPHVPPTADGYTAQIEILPLRFIDYLEISLQMPRCFQFPPRGDFSHTQPTYKLNFLSPNELIVIDSKPWVQIGIDCDGKGEFTYNMASGSLGANGYLFFEWPME